MEQYFKQEQTLLSQQDQMNMANIFPKSTEIRNQQSTSIKGQIKGTLNIEEYQIQKTSKITNPYKRKYPLINNHHKQMLKDQIISSEQQQFSSCFKQENSYSEGILNGVRKSTRIKKKPQQYEANRNRQKQKIKKNQIQNRTDLGYVTRVTMDQRQQRIHLKERIKQQSKTIPQIISIPGDSTLRQMNIKFNIQKGIFLYKITIDKKICKKCKKESQVQQFQKKQAYTNNICKQCRQGGQYWLTSEQMLKMKNAELVRKYYESYL